jgi:hypothetical protein
MVEKISGAVSKLITHRDYICRILNFLYWRLIYNFADKSKDRLHDLN